jgi:hypothetical protein
MLNAQLLNFRLPFLFFLLSGMEVVNLVKLATAMSWTNGTVLGIIASIALGLFLIFSIVALSFELDDTERLRLQGMVIGLFLVQTFLICIVSYLTSLSFMPAVEISQLFTTPPEPTRKAIAVTEAIAQNVATFAFWGVLANQWRKQIAAHETEGQVARLLLSALRGNNARTEERKEESAPAAVPSADPAQRDDGVQPTSEPQTFSEGATGQPECQKNKGGTR